jgi:hypothetical protein
MMELLLRNMSSRSVERTLKTKLCKDGYLTISICTNTDEKSREFHYQGDVILLPLPTFINLK